jgi:RNA polymerase sigma-70 factor (ECF subfamily)
MGVMVGAGALFGTRRRSIPDEDPGRSFEGFFRDEYSRLGRALFLLIGDTAEAEDVAQEAMVRVLERWDRVAAMDSPTGYLYSTALNLHRSRLRRLLVRRRHVAAPEPAGDPLGDVADRDEIGRLLDTLTDDQRAAIILVEWLGLAAEEAAPILGIEPVSVRVRVSRAKQALRDRATDQRKEA